MFEAVAGMYMAAKLQCMQMKANITRKHDQEISETIYKNKVDKNDTKEIFKKSLMPESGYMTVEEYEAKSRPLTRKEISAKILDKPDFPEDKRYVYIPQHEFKLVKYNDPVGSPELSLPRKLQFDRQINAQGIVSGDYTKLVYPAVYYYAEADCVSCDLFLIKLDPKLTSLEKVQRANVVNREPKPLLSTSKEVDNKFMFRTLTPIDFSTDNTKLAIKEKIGYKHDGIWETDLWVYDFNKKEAKKLTLIREAIAHYWQNEKKANMDDYRWDIYPMGFDANNDDRIIVRAIAYTGDLPKSLGIWSIDINNEHAKLESEKDTSMPVAIVGYKLAEEEDVKPVSQLEFDAKLAKKELKEKEKAEKAETKAKSAQELFEYRKKIHQMDVETLMKVRERKKEIKSNKIKQKDGITDNLGEDI